MADDNKDSHPLEIIRDEGGLLDLMDIRDLNVLEEEASHRIKIVNTLRVISLKITNTSDWTKHGENFHLGESGSSKIRDLFGLSLVSVEQEKKEESDAKGRYYIWTTKGIVMKGSVKMEVIGTASTRDKFFGKFYDKETKKTIWKELSEIDETNIKKKSFTNFEVNAVTRFMGLRNITAEELKKAGLDVDKIQVIGYKSSKKEATGKVTEHKEGKKVDLLSTGLKKRIEELAAQKGQKEYINKMGYDKMTGKEAMLLLNDLKEMKVSKETKGAKHPAKSKTASEINKEKEEKGDPQGEEGINRAEEEKEAVYFNPALNTMLFTDTEKKIYNDMSKEGMLKKGQLDDISAMRIAMNIKINEVKEYDKVTMQSAKILKVMCEYKDKAYIKKLIKGVTFDAEEKDVLARINSYAVELSKKE